MINYQSSVGIRLWRTLNPEYYKLISKIYQKLQYSAKSSIRDIKISGRSLGGGVIPPPRYALGITQTFLGSWHIYVYIYVLIHKPDSVVYIGFRGWGGVPEAMGGVLFYIGEMKNFAFFQTRKFSKNVKKAMNIL